jgi:hypothetical protein
VSPRFLAAFIGTLAATFRGGCTVPTAIHPSAALVVQEFIDHGQASYRIVTPSATWVYDREGAGFSSLFDTAGNDWISYRPTGGAAGNFRGIPNAVFRRNQDGNNFFHPGHAGPKGSVTTLMQPTPDRVVLRSRSRDGRWSCEWEILPDRARLRMTGVPADDNGYWFLYEGTPGGRVTELSERWNDDILATSWVAFISPAEGRALLLIVHQPPPSRVSYRPMENAMTVFGFGRTTANLENLLTRPVTFTVALLTETEPARISARAESLFNDK